MKKIIFCFVALVITSILFQYCKKDKNLEPTTQTVNKVLKINESYHFDLGNFGDEEGTSIIKQASHFLVSSISRTSNGSKIIYSYTPTFNFTGIDEVEIRSAKGSSGASENNKIAYTIIKFTITN